MNTHKFLIFIQPSMFVAFTVDFITDKYTLLYLVISGPFVDYSVTHYLDQRWWWNAVPTRTKHTASSESRLLPLYTDCLWRKQNHWTSIRQSTVGKWGA